MGNIGVRPQPGKLQLIPSWNIRGYTKLGEVAKGNHPGIGIFPRELPEKFSISVQFFPLGS
jgi:hypothetical protein